MFAGLFACASLLIGCGGGGSSSGISAEDAAKAKAEQPQMYPLDKCIVTGAPIDGNSIEIQHGVYQVMVANADAKAKFEAEPDKYLTIIKAAIAKMGGPPAK